MKDLESQWHDSSEATEPGRALTYSDDSIRIHLIIKVLYKLTCRQVEGYLESMFRMSGLNLEVPSCYTQMSRTAATIHMPLKRISKKKGPYRLYRAQGFRRRRMESAFA